MMNSRSETMTSLIGMGNIVSTRRMQSICGRAQRAEEARPATFARCAGTHAH